ncbi:MAG: ATP-dependent Clp protease ATP-binding subunit [Patescibacteria group bacterium]
MTDINILDSLPLSMRVLRLDTVFGSSARKKLTRILFSLFLFSIFVLLLFAFVRYAIAPRIPADKALMLAELPVWQVAGFVLIIFSIVFPCLLLEFYYRSYLAPARFIARGDTEFFASSEALRIFMNAQLLRNRPLQFREVLMAFAESKFTNILLLRLGIDGSAYVDCMNAERGVIQVQSELFIETICASAVAKKSNTIYAADILETLMNYDKAFAKLLFEMKIKKEDLSGAALWVEDMLDTERAREMWWSVENLSRIQGIGKDFGFGYTFTLDRYSHDLAYSTTRLSREARRDEIKAIEDVLSRSYEANILLVGEEGVGKHAVLEGLASRIREGTTVPALEHKRVVVLDGSGLTAATKTKGAYEELIIKLLNEAVAAGNIIVVLENLPGFIASSFELGTDIMEILEPYFSGASIQAIALSDKAAFHKELEPNGRIMKLFERVEIEEPNRDRALRMLEDSLDILEPRSGKFYTYKAVLRAYELADRFITTGAMPEKAIDLLDEVASAVSADTTFIMPDDIDAIVQKRTHIPTLQAEAGERDKLLHMEDLLHTRMIDQEFAIKAISDALRRARSGLKTGTRPVGSFLLLGPTGVGKTETAKALAEMYFGGTDAMIRFDMSEYHGEEGIRKLIGAYDSKEPGILASRLRERPFSLLLFDEFEKASHEVHNLFLQILDEGLFSDGAGKRVSAREAMIIATSNAGSDLVWDMLKAGRDPSKIQSEVVDRIRADGIFSPELLNRFDAIVVYHPLSKEQLVQVAMLLLKELKLKLEINEMHFEPTEELARRVVELGYDPAFGARPMRRAIADRVEQIIAKKILEGALKRGDTFTFSKEDIAGL